ncbi:hypothetical protein ONE63_008095 [Megalurothrips usitatus]|uniref:Uncharacterized protein n=1 Tax=Megalurothrips usitatus TaxID=439358 RepID=A0AAV7XPR2_9NEOP|nr:hypothetical protein ONE63_008095 [Megalurothrips usitatus]
MHQEQIKELEKFLDDPTNYGKSDPSVAFGISHRSVLMDIENCDVTKFLPQDFMHDTIEGTLKLEICCLLNDVLTNKLMTLTDINERIKLFCSCFGVNKPTQIDQKHLDKKKLRQTAAETLNLAFMLPFVLRKRRNGVMESVCREDNLKCFLLRLQLIDILMSDVLTLFEGKHAYFKRLMKILRSLKDPAGTFALRHQRKLCGEMLLSAKSDCGPFLLSSGSFGAAVFISLQTLFHVSGLLNVFSNIPNSAVLSQYKVVTVNGVAYGKRHALMVAVDDGAHMPRFGEILIRHDSKLAFEYRHMAVDGY